MKIALTPLEETALIWAETMADFRIPFGREPGGARQGATRQTPFAASESSAGDLLDALVAERIRRQEEGLNC